MGVQLTKKQLKHVNQYVAILGNDISSMLNHLYAVAPVGDGEDKVIVEDDTIGIAVCLVEYLSDNDAEPGPHGETVMLNASQLEYCQALHAEIMTMVQSLQPKGNVPDILLAKVNALLEMLNTVEMEETACI